MRLGLHLGLSGKPGEGVEPTPPGALWSESATWAGTLGHVPIAGDVVMIEVGQTICLDVDTPALAELHIEGTLIGLPGGTIGIESELIMVMDGGELQIGTAASPFTGTCTITLTGARSTHTTRTDDNALDNDGLVRALMVEDGGTLCIHGAVPALLKTKLNAHAAAAATTFTLADSVGWSSGDRVAISKTDFYDIGDTEQFTLASSTSGTAMATVGALTTARWGVLQYPTDAGLSLTAGTFTPPDALVPTVLDERAEVVNLSRKIIIQGANDSDWTSSGFGGHCMVMGVTSTAKVKGVEFRRMGQRRAMGRYPFHWHMLSYTPYISGVQAGGTYIDDVVDGDHYLKDCAIWDSENRAVTIHGTCGVEVDNCYAVDIQGHAFFFEDGSEERNTMSNCVAMQVRDPGATNRLKAHENFDASEAGGSSGFWYTNPNNTLTGNVASDCAGRGIWHSFASACFGLSRNVALVPRTTDLLLWEDNEGHSNRRSGIGTQFQVSNEAGDLTNLRYQPTGRITLTRGKTWKNGRLPAGETWRGEGFGGYQNFVQFADYASWTAADNEGRDFHGNTAPTSTLTTPLVVAESFNNATAFQFPVRIAFASYHHQIDIVDIAAFNYEFVTPTIYYQGIGVYGGGVFDGYDFYERYISLGMYRNSGWMLVNSNAGFITPPPYFDGFPLEYPVSSGAYRHWAMPVRWDPHGYWGDAGNYIITDVPFFTEGLSASDPVDPTGENGLSTPDLFYGFGNPVINNSPSGIFDGPTIVTIKMTRLENGGLSVVDEHTIGDPDVSSFFDNMRSFSIAKGGRFRLEYPDGEMPTTYFLAAMWNAYRSTDHVVVGIPWDGSVPVAGRYDAGYDANTQAQKLTAGTTRLFAFTGADIDDVEADTTGVTAWQDTANDLVWVNLVGGMTLNVVDYDGVSDASLHREHWLRLWPA
jgi:hypothetical protein